VQEELSGPLIREATTEDLHLRLEFQPSVAVAVAVAKTMLLKETVLQAALVVAVHLKVETVRVETALLAKVTEVVMVVAGLAVAVAVLLSLACLVKPPIVLEMVEMAFHLPLEAT
jgi:hypothetical protein